MARAASPTPRYGAQVRRHGVISVRNGFDLARHRRFSLPARPDTLDVRASKPVLMALGSARARLREYEIRLGGSGEVEQPVEVERHHEAVVQAMDAAGHAAPRGAEWRLVRGMRPWADD